MTIRMRNITARGNKGAGLFVGAGAPNIDIDQGNFDDNGLGGIVIEGEKGRRTIAEIAKLLSVQVTPEFQAAVFDATRAVASKPQSPASAVMESKLGKYLSAGASMAAIVKLLFDLLG